MMCPREVCRVCGEPRRRVERTTYARTRDGGAAFISNGHHGEAGVKQKRTGGDNSVIAIPETLGWTDCDCSPDVLPYGNPLNVCVHGREHAQCIYGCRFDRFRPGIVLDPFAGTGTTLAVADLHGRDAIGVDFDERNRAIYPARYDEVKRALYGTPAPMPGQMELLL